MRYQTKNIDREAKKFAKSLGLDKRMECYSKQSPFIELKDHKANFKNNTKCRLINPSKSEFGLVSKHYLSSIISTVAEKSGVNQWKNTSTVIKWFENLQNKQKRRFIKFDIADFHPSITEHLLERSIKYAKSCAMIEHKALKAISLARKSLLFNKHEIWVKKDNSSFDVTMGSFDGAEICEIVELYLLNKLSNLLGKVNVWLYRHDGIAAINSCCAPVLNRTRKKIITLFKKEILNITIETNIAEINFLDVTFNLVTEKYLPYRKPNSNPLYINAKSNHPPTIIKDLPKMINKRLSDLSFNEDEFEKAKPLHENALKESGYKAEMKHETSKNINIRNRHRKIIWFNPPFSQSLKTNIGKIFLKLVRKHFPRDHKLHKIFNPNTLKLSYCSMKNISNIIKQHNATVLATSTTPKR